MKAGDVSASVEQFSEGRLADSRSMLDLPVDGLNVVESVGGWLGVDGLEAAGKAPAECGGAAFLAEGRPPPSSTQEEGISNVPVSACEVDLSFGSVRQSKPHKWIAKNTILVLPWK